VTPVSNPAAGDRPPEPHPTESPPRQAHRVIFIDLARSLAVVLMVLGHTSSALLDTSYRSGPWFEAWTFQRGLTSGLFLLLAGFAFSIATVRHWTTHLRWSPPVFKRVRRFLLFVLLGYALHFPVPRLIWLPEATSQQWRAFLAIDVLQLIGVALLALQAMVMITRTRPAFMIATFASAAAIVAVSPFMWRTDWTMVVPPWTAGYLSPGTGALFPLFPWLSYVFVGAAMGQLYARWGASHLAAFANRAMLVPGAVLLTSGFAIEGVTSDVLIRLGSCLIVVGLLAHASRRIDQLPHVYGAVAQESLVVYFVHLCVVYGSIWNPGLASVWGESLSLGATVLAAVAVAAVMIALAFRWNRLKHVRPKAARWVTATAGIVLTARLL
jgi:uncharacterized membrane protein